MENIETIVEQSAENENATIVQSADPKQVVQDRLKLVADNLKKATELMEKGNSLMKWAGTSGIENVASGLSKPGEEAGVQVNIESLSAIIEKRQKANRAANKLLGDAVDQLALVKMDLPGIE